MVNRLAGKPDVDMPGSTVDRLPTITA